MPTKSELLKEKTTETLKNMARDKDLSGYSDMKKNELIDLINSNYTKSEIQAWTEAGKEKEEKYGKLIEPGMEVLSSLESKFEIFNLSTDRNSFSTEIDRENIHNVLSFLKERGFDHLSDVACIDYIDDGEFELIYHLWSHSSKLRAAIKARISREPKPSVKSITDLWAGAQIHERENHEMFGIDFTGNPNLKPLFLEDWEELPPLRKDFGTRDYVKKKYYGGKYEYGE